MQPDIERIYIITLIAAEEANQGNWTEVSNLMRQRGVMINELTKKDLRDEDAKTLLVADQSLMFTILKGKAELVQDINNLKTQSRAKAAYQNANLVHGLISAI